jgi:predicted RNA-binding Zn-ribbon protein involved in translation (DUF1610 family)
MLARYICPNKSCNNEVIVSAINSQAHFKRRACDKCGHPLHFKEIVKEDTNARTQ